MHLFLQILFLINLFNDLDSHQYSLYFIMYESQDAIIFFFSSPYSVN